MREIVYEVPDFCFVDGEDENKCPGYRVNERLEPVCIMFGDVPLKDEWPSDSRFRTMPCMDCEDAERKMRQCRASGR